MKNAASDTVQIGDDHNLTSSGDTGRNNESRTKDIEAIEIEVTENPNDGGVLETTQNMIANNTRLQIIPDLNDTEIVTSTANIYYAL